MHKIFNMRDFPQGHSKVSGYKSGCSCCSARKDELKTQVEKVSYVDRQVQP